MRFSRPLLCLACLLVVAGCSTVPASSDPAPQRNRHLITAEEISARKLLSAYHAVSTLRPNWLHRRGPVNTGNLDIVVYIDTSRMGGPRSLQAIPASEIKAIHFLSGRDAQTRFGEGHEHGAIIVITP